MPQNTSLGFFSDDKQVCIDFYLDSCSLLPPLSLSPCLPELDRSEISTVNLHLGEGWVKGTLARDF